MLAFPVTRAQGELSVAHPQAFLAPFIPCAVMLVAGTVLFTERYPML